MRFIKYFSLIAVIMLLINVCSCTKGVNNIEVEISPSDKSLVDLASKTYDETQLLKIAKFKGSINEINTEYPVECLRKDNNMYRVSYLGDGNIAVLMFDDLGNRIFGNIYSTKLLKSDFGSLKKGQLLDEVRAIDPNGEYLFLYTGRNDTPKKSSHYTKDGYLITIKYDISNVIISINEELI